MVLILGKTKIYQNAKILSLAISEITWTKIILLSSSRHLSY